MTRLAQLGRVCGQGVVPFGNRGQGPPQWPRTPTRRVLTGSMSMVPGGPGSPSAPGRPGRPGGPCGQRGREGQSECRGRSWAGREEGFGASAQPETHWTSSEQYTPPALECSRTQAQRRGALQEVGRDGASGCPLLQDTPPGLAPDRRPRGSLSWLFRGQIPLPPSGPPMGCGCSGGRRVKASTRSDRPGSQSKQGNALTSTHSADLLSKPGP